MTITTVGTYVHSPISTHDHRCVEMPRERTYTSRAIRDHDYNYTVAIAIYYYMAKHIYKDK